MRVVVAVRGVFDNDSLAGRQGGGVDLMVAAYRPNDNDDQALEAALKLKETHGGSVVAVSVSPARQAEPALRRALALGVDEALPVWDDVLEGADAAATASILAAVLRKLEAQLALFGERSDDTGGGALPGYVSELLGWPLVAQALALSVDGATGSARRRLPGGYREAVEFDLPAVVSMASAAQPVRYAKVIDQRRADRAHFEARRPSDLGLDMAAADPRPRVRVERLTLPKPTCAVPTAASHPSPEARMMLALAETGGRVADVLSGGEAIRAAIQRLTEAGLLTTSEV